MGMGTEDTAGKLLKQLHDLESEVDAFAGRLLVAKVAAQGLADAGYAGADYLVDVLCSLGDERRDGSVPNLCEALRLMLAAEGDEARWEALAGLDSA